MRWFSCLLAAFLIALLAVGPGVPAAPAAAPADLDLPLAFWDGPILGNRTRMIQFACIGMALAIFILTRGHKQGK